MICDNRLGAATTRIAKPATLFFRQPPERVVEIGAQVEI
jgi:hypothetical protein